MTVSLRLRSLAAQTVASGFASGSSTAGGAEGTLLTGPSG